MAHGESGIFTSRIPMGMNSALRNSSHQQQPQRLCSAPRIRTAIYNYNSTIIMAINACHAGTHTQISLCGAVLQWCEDPASLLPVRASTDTQTCLLHTFLKLY